MLNPLYEALARKMRAKQYQLRPSRTKSRFDGQRYIDPSATAVNVNPVANIATVLPPTRPLKKGSTSPFNPNAALHRNLITVKLSNENSTYPAHIILTSGRHNFAPPNASGLTLSDQLVTDGVNATTNNDGQTVNVALSAEFGLRAGASWAEFLTVIKEYGVSIAGMRVDYQTQDQMANRFVFQHYDFMGNDYFDFLNPNIYYDPTKYHDKTIMIEEAFSLNRDTVLYYTLDPSESVTLYFWLDSILDTQSSIVDYTRNANYKAL